MKIVFVSTMNNDPWGGSEYLWSEAALRLMRAGHTVAASVPGWPRRVPQIAALMKAGLKIEERRMTPDQLPPRSLKRVGLLMLDPFIRQAFRRQFARWLAKAAPDLVCISNGSFADNMPLLESCMAAGFPYVTVAHANAEHLWPDDTRARIILELYRRARRTFFVSKANCRLLETQLGVQLPNAGIIRNPFNVSRDAAPPWPANSEPVSLACVARLDPSAKGQDILLNVLARDVWRSRPIQVSFFGKGRCEEGLRRLTNRLQLQEKVKFCGNTNDIEGVWATHHALILPSRFEGLPLAIVEAMHCGRPAIVTDVAGNAEIVEDGVTGFVAAAPTERHLHEALERAWEQRQNWQTIGAVAARAIREIVPADAVGDFTQKLLDAAGDASPMKNNR
jgi:glycosyltransferase involved in cell wall biosynthesis